MFELFVPTVMQVLGAVAALLGAAALKSATFVKLVNLSNVFVKHIIYYGQQLANIRQTLINVVDF